VEDRRRWRLEGGAAAGGKAGGGKRVRRQERRKGQRAATDAGAMRARKTMEVCGYVVGRLNIVCGLASISTRVEDRRTPLEGPLLSPACLPTKRPSSTQHQLLIDGDSYLSSAGACYASGRGDMASACRAAFLDFFLFRFSRFLWFLFFLRFLPVFVLLSFYYFKSSKYLFKCSVLKKCLKF
jgi:hypothetical protein